MPRKDTNYMCSSIIRIESVYLKLEEHKYYPQVFLETCRHGPDNRALRLDESDESDESDKMPDGCGDELSSDYEFDADNNES